jgi:hypothetical protein
MADVYGVLIEGATITTGPARDSQSATETYILDDLGGDGARVLRSAIQDNRIPRDGDAHPFLPNWIVSQRTFEAIGNRQVRAIISYQPATAVVVGEQVEEQEPSDEAIPVVEVGATVESVTTNIDVLGNPLNVSYNGDIQNAQVERLIPVVSARLTRLEPFNPIAKAAAYVGSINALPFLGQVEKRWLIRSVTGQSTKLQSGTFAYRVTYELLLSPEDNWDKTINYVDPATNLPPPDVRFGNGLARVQVYPARDFAPLKLE